MKRLCAWLAVTSTVLGSAAMSAQVKLPNIFSDHGVLQRDMPIHVWGSAQPGETVHVSLHAQTKDAKADSAGHWEVFLAAERAGGPFVLKASGSSTVEVKDLLIGDVWIASGQSNMAYGMKGNGVPPKGSTMPHTPELIAAANVPTLRLIRVPETIANTPQSDQDGKWMTCTPANVTTFSAIGYFFGRALTEQEHVPIGIIDNAYSGSPIAGWLSAEAMSSNPSLKPVVESWPAIKAKHPTKARQGALARLPPAGQQWQMSGIFNALVAPVDQYAIKGAMWYQGESDSGPDQAPYYYDLLPAMITDWRAHWHEGNFPFLIAQISSFKGNGPHAMWGTIRDAERSALTLPNTALSVTLDIGDPDDIHPPDKPDAAKRLVMAAKALAYGDKTEYEGPLFESAKPKGDAMVVGFTHAAGLMAKGGEARSFELAGADGKFVSATATISGTSATVKSAAVAQPKFVRFGWSNATDANLYNSAGLPASTFTTGPRPAASADTSPAPE